MRVLVVALFVGAVGWLLVPAAIRRHRQASVTASVADFQQHIRLLATRLVSPSHRPPQPVRRPAARRVLVARWLAGATLLWLPTAALAGGWWYALPLGTATLYTLHLGLVHRLRRRAEVRAKVHHLPVRPQPRPAPALVRAQ